MDDKLRNMYDDFFGMPLVMDDTKEETKENEEKIDIDSLLIDESSKELLKRIDECALKFKKLGGRTVFRIRSSPLKTPNNYSPFSMLKK